MNILKLSVGSFLSNCYLVYSEKSLLVIDPGEEWDFISQKIEEIGISPSGLFLTHAHSDHYGACLYLSLIYGCPLYVSSKDYFLVKKLGIATRFLSSKHLFDGLAFDVVSTPGHTPGSVCFVFKDAKTLFVGDLIFKNGEIGRYDFSYSNKISLFASIKRIKRMFKDFKVMPGHGEEFYI